QDLIRRNTVIDLKTLARPQVDPPQRSTPAAFVNHHSGFAGDLKERATGSDSAGKARAKGLRAAFRKTPGEDAVSPGRQAAAIQRSAGDLLAPKAADLMPVEMSCPRHRHAAQQEQWLGRGGHRNQCYSTAQ